MNILITGISGNLGVVTAHHLVSQGHNVIGCSQSGKKVPHVKTMRADLADEVDAERVVNDVIREQGRIDAGVLLVGGFTPGNISKTDWKLLDKMINLNFRTAWNVVRPLYPHMIANGRGRIILIGAKPGLESGAATGAVAYGISKSLIFRLSEIINEGGREQGLDSAVIVPGVIDTPQNREAMPKSDFSKWVTTETIAHHIGSLCSPSLRPLTETVIKLYGDG